MPPPRPWFARYAWAVLLYNVAVVIWGAFVRASGSGAGCGNRWPNCPGVLASASPALKTIIEFIHRSTSGVDLVMVAILVLWAFRAFPAKHPARRSAILSAVFLMAEALLGAALVLLEHVATDQSIARVWWLSLHQVNTLTLLACLTLTAWWAEGEPMSWPRGKAAWTSLLAVVLTGITGVIAALGDTLFPASSLSKSIADDFSPASSLYLRLRVLHPFVAVAAAVYLLYFASIVPSRPRLRLALVLLVLAQVAAGALNLLLLAPVWMQLLHLAIADGVWIVLVLLCTANLGD